MSAMFWSAFWCSRIPSTVTAFSSLDELTSFGLASAAGAVPSTAKMAAQAATCVRRMFPLSGCFGRPPDRLLSGSLVLRPVVARHAAVTWHDRAHVRRAPTAAAAGRDGRVHVAPRAVRAGLGPDGDRAAGRARGRRLDRGR